MAKEKNEEDESRRREREERLKKREESRGDEFQELSAEIKKEEGNEAMDVSDSTPAAKSEQDESGEVRKIYP
jgi:hypothetical protein